MKPQLNCLTDFPVHGKAVSAPTARNTKTCLGCLIPPKQMLSATNKHASDVRMACQVNGMYAAVLKKGLLLWPSLIFAISIDARRRTGHLHDGVRQCLMEAIDVVVPHLHVGLEQAPVKSGQYFLVVADELPHLYRTNESHSIEFISQLVKKLQCNHAMMTARSQYS